MKISNSGLNLIKKFEGCKLVAYKPVPTEKYWTIGYGHYGSDVTKGMVITQNRAEELLKRDITPIERTLNSLCINFTQNAFDSLVSWIYNLGMTNFNSSTMKRYILSKKSDVEITDQMIKWHNSNGKPLLGLKKRRVAEANMWLGYEGYFVDASGNIKKK